MHPVVIPIPFSGASRSLCEVHRTLVEESNSLTRQRESIVGEPSPVELLHLLEFEVNVRQELSSYLIQLDEELSKSLTGASQRVMKLRSALQALRFDPQSVAEYKDAANEVEVLVEVAEHYTAAATDNSKEIADLALRIRHLEES